MKTFILANVFLWLLFVISDAVILGIFNLVGIIATLVVNYLQNKKIDIVKKQQEAIGVQIDGKMDQLLDVNKKASKAEGHLAGKAEEKDEQRDRDEQRGRDEQ